MINYDLVLIVVPHKKIVEKGSNWILSLLNKNGIIFDLKGKIHSLKSHFSL